jgi:hypothetical protein
MDIRSADAATASVAGVANSDGTRFLSLFQRQNNGDNNGAALIWDSKPIAYRFGNGRTSPAQCHLPNLPGLPTPDDSVLAQPLLIHL